MAGSTAQRAYEEHGREGSSGRCQGQPLKRPMRRFVSRGMHRQSGSILGLLELCFVCVCFRSESAAEVGNLKMEKRLSEEPKMAALGYAVA